MHIFLDESGDLGFDFKNKSPSKFFTITLLICNTTNEVKVINKSIERAFKNKVSPKSKHRIIREVKGTGVTLQVKKYFFRNSVSSKEWGIYTIILDKKSELHKVPHPINAHRIYNLMANKLIQQIDFSTTVAVNLFVDKSKNRAGINEFDTMLQVSLNTLLPLNVPLNITHLCSQRNRGIQAVDLFCWGVYRKHEHQDAEWYDIFKERIATEEMFVI